ncbi:hypothetical protein DNHGIG_14050 [Collibacillus ludicampi]|uniref:Uncharacterized protein n=1 Tax=Collibacillus ludicampi TaxID=2771369 RepID=A0AAV4LDK6_9BACL|nr:hypothetical protein [Collibacillus ludicampi]GIM45856.1 hypothetical protein DNHGIG_14050 [Collibacillus ludicampi]
MSKDVQEERLMVWKPGMPLPSRKETHGRKRNRRWWKWIWKKEVKTAGTETSVRRRPEQKDSLSRELSDESVQTSGLPLLTVTVQDLLTEEEKQALLEMASSANEISVSVAVDVKTTGSLSRTSRTKKRGSERESRTTRSAWTRFLRRSLFVLIAVPLALAFIFWAKFAYVYDIPSAFTDSMAAARADGYVVYKTWWFGPPFFDLASYGNPSNAGEMREFYERLGEYRIIVDSPSRVVWRYYRGSR